MERKLASIQRVVEVNPIQGADKIEVAKILGWLVVIKKGEYKPGDLCVYAEIDSIMPERAEFEFLKDRHYRIKTVKLRGQISQGIAFKLSVLPPGTKIEEGMDVTDMLGVTKYLPRIPAQLMGVTKGDFPSFIPKTDEQRIQSVPGVLERHKGRVFYVTEKVDGSSMTVYRREGVFGVCSRNLDLLETAENALWKMARQLGLEEKLAALGFDAAIQAELFGMGVQGNRYAREKAEIAVFNIFNIAEHCYLDYAEFTDACKKWNLPTVPVIDDAFVLNHNVDELIKAAEGSSKLNPAIPREGIVIRSLQETRDPEVGRLSFKVINNQFLLKFEE
ncbi:MAG: RNA ligase (ATP) [Verrucomicrobia bacterium]|nr:RNA ligase (ATP) [Verrucomicrobiota bacterium]